MSSSFFVAFDLLLACILIAAVIALVVLGTMSLSAYVVGTLVLFGLWRAGLALHVRMRSGRRGMARQSSLHAEAVVDSADSELAGLEQHPFKTA